jgi:hypothetical protein
MPNYNGVWSLSTVYQAYGDGKWPPPLSGDIGVFFHGASTDVIDYVTITALGNTTDFGNLSATNQGGGSAASSNTRGVYHLEYTSTNVNILEFVTINKPSNTTDFGDLTSARFSGTAAVSNQTRGVYAGGYLSNYSNVMDYITIATLGNAIDFGDLTSARDSLKGLMSSTRGVFNSGRTTSSDYNNMIDYITIASTGNATDFGDSTRSVIGATGSSNGVRGVYAGGYNSTVFGSTGNVTEVMEYITIASTGNATDFGDLTDEAIGAATSNATRAVMEFQRDHASGTNTDVINYWTIATTGNAADFGDQTSAAGAQRTACSNAHGGLQ